MSNCATSVSPATLPAGWRWVKLGEVCEINPSRPKYFSRSPDAPTTFIPMSAINGKTGNVTESQIVKYSKVSKGYTYFEEGDVLFSKITPCMQNGKHIIAKNLIDKIGFGTTEFHVLKPNNEILSDWIYYFIRQQFFLKEATAYFTGVVGQQRVPESFLSNYVIPLPPLEEQKRIAVKLQELMQEVELARISCEKQLEAAKALPMSYLKEVFESEEAKKWERKRLGEVCEIMMGQSPPGSTYIDKPLGLPFFQGKIDFGEYFPTARVWCSKPIKIAEKEDILMSVRAPVGPINMNKLKCCIGRGLAAIRCKDNIINWFIFWYLRYLEAQIASLGSGSTFAAINRYDLNNFQIVLPPIEEQKRIATELKEKMSEAEKLYISIKKQLETINALPQAILKKAFRGEL